MMLYVIKQNLIELTVASSVLKKRLRNTLNVTVLLLLSVSVVGCETFVGVEKALPTPVKLKVYVPPRPAPVIPVNLTLSQVNNQVAKQLSEDGIAFDYTAMSIEDGSLLMTWLAAIKNNQRAWANYAKYWEDKFK